MPESISTSRSNDIRRREDGLTAAQEELVQLLMSRPRALLADPGYVVRTREAIEVAARLRRSGAQAPALVIAESGRRAQWLLECYRFAPDLKTMAPGLTATHGFRSSGLPRSGTADLEILTPFKADSYDGDVSIVILDLAGTPPRVQLRLLSIANCAERAIVLATVANEGEAQKLFDRLRGGRRPRGPEQEWVLASIDSPHRGAGPRTG